MADFGQNEFDLLCVVLCCVVLCCVVLCCVVLCCVVCVVLWVLFHGVRVGFHVWVLVSRFGLDRPSPGPPFPWTALPLDRPSPGPPFRPSPGPPFPWTALPLDRPSPGPPKISLFFFPLPPQNSFFSSLSGCLLVEFWWCFLKTGALKCARLGSLVVVWNPGGPTRPGRRGSHTTTRELQTRTFERHQRFKHHQNSTRRHPEREEKNEFCGGRGKKKREILGRPTLRAPTLRGPTLRGPTLRAPTFSGFWPPPTLRAPHPSGPHPSGPHFFWVRAPTLRAPSLRTPLPSGPLPSGPLPSGPRPSGPRPSGPTLRAPLGLAPGLHEKNQTIKNHIKTI